MIARTRILLRRFHLWLGLSLGLIFVLLGLTGSALIFYVEIDAALHPAVRSEAAVLAPGWNSTVWDRALATGRSRHGDPAGSWSLEATGTGGAIPARYYPSASHGHHAEREMLWFSSDGARIVRAEPWGGYLMSWLYELHMHLLVGELGSQIVGWSGFATILLLLSGLIAWWPRGSWRKALAYKRDGPPVRRLRDQHKLFGLWSALLLAILAFTGGLLALPKVRTQVLTATIATPDMVPEPLSSAASGQQIPIARALAAAHRALPDARLAFIDVPGHGAKPFRMRVQVPGDPHRRFPSSYVFVDQYSARVLAVRDMRRGNAATSAAAWIRALHDASVGGLPTRILGMLLGIVPLLLFITGLRRWRLRIAARNRTLSTRNSL